MIGRTRPRRDERGAFLVLWVLLIVAMLVMVAIVVDLGSYRSDRRDNRRAADAAAAAGALDLATTAASRQLACQKAWDYAWSNIDSSLATPGPSGCSGLTTACNNSTPPTSVSATRNGFTVTVTTPVVDGSPLMSAEVIGGDIAQSSSTGDGSRCERLGVEISESRATFFSGLIGQSNHSTTIHSVARRLSSTIKIPASLVVLEPYRCTAFSQSGDGTVLVEDDTSPPDRGGMVIVSDGTATSGDTGCSSSRPTLNSQGNGSIRVSSPGDIFLAALPVNATTCSGTACQQSDVEGGHISPQPTGMPRVPGLGRELVEYVFNCKENYNATGPDPNYMRVFQLADGSGGTLAACEDALADADDRDYIDTLVDNADIALRDFNGISGANIQTIPAGPCVLPFIVSPTAQALDVRCTVPANATVAVSVPNVRFRSIAGSGTNADIGQWTILGNAFFDQRLDLGNGDLLTVSGNVVLNNGMQASNGSTAIFSAGAGSIGVCGNAADRWLGWVDPPTRLSCLRSHSPTAGWAITRGSINMTGAGTFTSRRLAWYGSSAAQLNLNGNLTWTMPTDGPLARLALWSDWDNDGSSSHSMTAGGSMIFEGVFFSPVAEFRIRGSFPTNPQSAQFITQTFDISGNGTFRMAPDPRLIEIPVLGGIQMIR